MEVALVLLRKQGEKRRFVLRRDVTTIGRREDCDLRIPLGDVSRKHSSILLDEGRITIQDLGSSNGTYVNGRRVQEHDLAAGDAVRIGSLLFVVQIDNQPPVDELSPPVPAPQDAPHVHAGGAAALNPTAASEVGDASDESAAFAALGDDDEPAAARRADPADSMMVEPTDGRD